MPSLKIIMEFIKKSKSKIKIILILISLLFLLAPTNAAVVSIYANFEHLKIPFTQWYHGGNAEIIEKNGNKVLEVSGGSLGRVLGVDIQNSPYIRLDMDVKIVNTTDGYLRVVVFGHPMSAEEYKEEREICGIYLNNKYIFGFNGSVIKLVPTEKGWNHITLNIDANTGIASLEYEGKKYIFGVPKTTGRYFIFRIDPGTKVLLDEINLKAGKDYYELFDQYTFSKVTVTPTPVTIQPTKITTTPSPIPSPLPTPNFEKLKIILDKNFELLYKTKYNAHYFYIVKYYNYLPPGTGVEVVTEKGLKIGIEDKELVKDIINTLNTSNVEKELLYKSWEDRQNGIITVYVSIIAFLLFLLGLLAIIVWKT